MRDVRISVSERVEEKVREDAEGLWKDPDEKEKEIGFKKDLTYDTTYNEKQPRRKLQNAVTITTF